MTLTPAQQLTLKNHILATPELNAFPNNEDGAAGIANLLNLQAVPDYTAWKTSLPLVEVMDAINGDELDGLTTANTGRLNVFAAYHPDGITKLPNQADKRQLFDGVFSGAGGNLTRPALLELYKRFVNEIEKLFATGAGAGSDADPDTLDFEGNISRQDVQTARNSV